MKKAISLYDEELVMILDALEILQPDDEYGIRLRRTLITHLHKVRRNESDRPAPLPGGRTPNP